MISTLTQSVDVLQVNEAFQILGDSQKRQLYDTRFNTKSHGRWMPSEDLQRRMKERAEWAQRQEEQQRARIEAIRKQRQEDILRAQEIEHMAQMVNEMVETLNNEIPGWAERKQKVQQMKAAREAKAKQARRVH